MLRLHGASSPPQGGGIGGQRTPPGVGVSARGGVASASLYVDCRTHVLPPDRLTSLMRWIHRSFPGHGVPIDIRPHEMVADGTDATALSGGPTSSSRSDRAGPPASTPGDGSQVWLGLNNVAGGLLH